MVLDMLLLHQPNVFSFSAQCYVEVCAVHMSRHRLTLAVKRTIYSLLSSKKKFFCFYEQDVSVGDPLCQGQ